MKRYTIKTYGCKLNQAESGGLEMALSEKFEKTSEENADFIVIIPHHAMPFNPFIVNIGKYLLDVFRQ